MIFNKIKLLFSQNPAKNLKSDSASEFTNLLNNISNGVGEYASFAVEENQEKRIAKSQEMLRIINDIDNKSHQFHSSSLYYSLAIAYRNYCGWFARGDERKNYLDKCLSFLRKAIVESPDNSEAKAELGRLLIEEKVIRNLSEGVRILEGLNKKGQMPSFLNSVLSKAHRQLGNVALSDRVDLCAFTDPSPAVFREERKKYRALIRRYKKENNSEKLKTTLEQYYNLAVLVSVCYGDHDCNSGVIGWQYDDAVKLVRKVCNKIDYSFVADGILENSNFISKNDWKTFVKVFGESDKKYDPKSGL